MNGESKERVLDTELERAIYESVAAANESEKVAKRLVAWLSELSLGRARLDEGETTRRFFDNVRSVLSDGDEV